MKVFISWSGQRAKHVADALKDWLPMVINDIEPWFSGDDIEAGARWNSEIAKQLETTDVGILCVTRESMNAAWLLFEAGALAKAIDKTRVCPYLIDLTTTDLIYPLAQFHAVQADRDGTLKLITTLHKSRATSHLTDEQLGRVFEKMWPDLESVVERLPQIANALSEQRTDRSLLEELLQTVRDIAKRDTGTQQMSTTPEAREVDGVYSGAGVINIDCRQINYDGALAMFVQFGRLSLKRFVARLLEHDFVRTGLRDLNYGTEWVLVDPIHPDVAFSLSDAGDLALKTFGLRPGSMLKIVIIGS